MGIHAQPAPNDPEEVLEQNEMDPRPESGTDEQPFGVTSISVAEIEGKMGIFYKPEFTIDSWIPRPSTWPNEDQGGVGLKSAAGT